MANKILKYFDKNTATFVIATSVILAFYSKIILEFYILILILVYIINYKWNIFDFKRLNRFLINLAVIVITLFIITILSEVWLQLYPHRLTGIDGVDTVGNFSDYTSRRYLTEDVFKKKNDVVRILGLGDSFSIYLKDKGKNYNDFLQQRFLANDKGTVEIINAGMEAMGPGYYWHILKKYGDLFKPDLVLVGFFVGNDFHEGEFFVSIGNFINEPKDLTKRYSKYYQFHNWRLYRLLKNKYTRYWEAEKRKQEAKTLPPQQMGTFSQETFLEVEKARSWIFDKKNRKMLHQEYDVCAAIFLKMKDWCDRRNIKLVLAIFPDQFQVDEELREAVLARYKNPARKNLDLSYPDNLIMNFCRAHDINCLDLLGPFQEKGKSWQLYALRDTHWNEAGNRLAADLIFQYLEEDHLLPSRPRP
jgi:low affinity Fe/Cu permease